MALVPHPQPWEVPPSVKHCTHIRGRSTFLELILQHPTILHYALLDATTIESLNFAKYFDLRNLLPWLTRLQKEAGQTAYPFDCFALLETAPPLLKEPLSTASPDAHRGPGRMTGWGSCR